MSFAPSDDATADPRHPSPPSPPHDPPPGPPLPDGLTVLSVAVVTGLVASLCSALIVSLGAGLVGRDPVASWMEIATVLIGPEIAERDPTLRPILTGLLAHLLAGIWWATLFWGMLVRWTWRLRPRTLIYLLPGWALLTAASEYYILLPGVQQWLLMQMPFWFWLGIHLATVAAYPLFYLIRRWIDGDDWAGRRAGRIGLDIVGAALVVVVLFGWVRTVGLDRRIELFGDPAVDREFLVLMTAHNEAAIDLADLTAQRGNSPVLRDLGLFLAAEAELENRSMEVWWSAWERVGLPEPRPDQLAVMPGRPTDAELAELATLTGTAFDRRLASIFARHLDDAVAITDWARTRASDVRTRLLAQQLYHARLNQIERLGWYGGGRVPPVDPSP